MPSYQGHVLGGIAAFIVAASIAPSTYIPKTATALTFLGEFSICIFGALFPDIDTKSMGRKYFYYALTVGTIIAIMQKAYPLLFFLSILAVFPLLTPHRGMTHNPLFLAIAPVVLIRIAHPDAPWLDVFKFHHYIFFVAGAMSHIILDYSPIKFSSYKKKKKKKHH